MTSFIVIRIRGTVNITGKTQDTMRMLHLTRPNHATIIPKTDSYQGMLNRVKDYVAYGEIDATTAATLLKTRGRLVGDKPVTDAFINEATAGKYKTVADFANAVSLGKAKVADLGEAMKPLFRLHPPKGGHAGSIKKHHTVGGVLGYCGKDINKLVGKMLNKEQLAAAGVAGGA